MNPLTDILPPAWRQVFYAVLFVVGLAFAVWQASDGNWTQFVLGLVTALGGGTAASNIDKKPRRTRAGAGNRGRLELRLDGNQVSEVETGRRIQAALDAYHRTRGE